MNSLKYIKRKVLFGLTSCLICAMAAGKLQAENVIFRFVHAETNTPIVLLELSIDGVPERFLSDSTGSVALNLTPNVYDLIARHTEFLELKSQIEIARTDTGSTQFVFKMQAIRAFETASVLVFNQKQPTQRAGSSEAIESELAISPGVNVIRRAGFAAEPIVNGIKSSGRGLTIDGMQIQGACVDHMDPAAAYVEPTNLQKAEIAVQAPDLEHPAVIGGGINLKMRAAELLQAWRAKIGFTYNTNGQGRHTHVNVAGGDSVKAIHLSLSQRSREDYRAGQNQVISGSAFEKWNAHLAGTLKLDQNHELRASLLFDATRDVGYPAMIMDARMADAYLGSITHNLQFSTGFLRKLETRLYANRIQHWMDDYDRSQTEIRNRTAMPGMHMPMFGESATIGLAFKTHLQISAALLPRVKLNLFQRRFDADMRMINLDEPTDQAYVKTIGGYVSENLALSASLPLTLSANLLIQSTVRLEMGLNRLEDPVGRRALEASTGLSASPRLIFSGGLNTSLLWQAADNTTLHLSFAALERAPTPLELYGNLLFEVSDGYFYLGNPNIRPEAALQLTIGADHLAADWNIAAKLFAYLIKDVIGGQDFGSEPDSDLRRFANLGTATRTGLEVKAGWAFHRLFMLESELRYYTGYNHSLHDPLGFIPQPQLRTSLRFRYELNDGQSCNASLSLRALLESNQRSQFVADTPAAAAAAIFDFALSWPAHPSLVVTLDVENLLDDLYTDRLSVNGLAHVGRSFRLGCQYTIE